MAQSFCHSDKAECHSHSVIPTRPNATVILSFLQSWLWHSECLRLQIVGMTVRMPQCVHRKCDFRWREIVMHTLYGDVYSVWCTLYSSFPGGIHYYLCGTPYIAKYETQYKNMERTTLYSVQYTKKCILSVHWTQICNNTLQKYTTLYRDIGVVLHIWLCIVVHKGM